MTRLLYVDDDPLMLRATARALTPFGWAVNTQSRPVAPEGFDAALLDWQPHGPEMAERCKAAGVPYAIYTGDIDSVPGDYKVVLSKPTSSKNLDATLRALLEEKGDNATDLLITRAELAVLRNDILRAHDVLDDAGVPRTSDDIDAPEPYAELTLAGRIQDLVGVFRARMTTPGRHRWDVTCLLDGGGAITYERIWADTRAEAVDRAKARIETDEPSQTVVSFGAQRCGT